MTNLKNRLYQLRNNALMRLKYTFSLEVKSKLPQLPIPFKLNSALIYVFYVFYLLCALLIKNKSKMLFSLTFHLLNRNNITFAVSKDKYIISYDTKVVIFNALKNLYANEQA